MPDGAISFDGRHSEIEGTGVYAGAGGHGSFEGKRIGYPADGGETRQRGRIELEVP